MTTKHLFRTLACSTLTLLPLVALGCGSDNPASGTTPQATAGGPAPTTGPSAAAPDKPADNKPADTTGNKPADATPPSNTTTPAKPSAGNQPNTTPPPAADPKMDPAKPSTDPAKPAADPGAAYPDIRGKCDINSGYPGDEFCVVAPPAEEGILIHVGPKDYKNEAEVKQYLLQPGDETSQCWTHKTPNDKEMWYQSSVLSGRAGTHHIINTQFESGSIPDGGFGACGGGQTATGSIPGASKAYMPRTHVAPEYADVGKKLPAQATIQSDMHYFNFTDKPLLREYWMVLYTADANSIKREALQIRGMGGFGWNSAPIQPGTDMVYKYACPVKGDGAIMNLLGHYHAHGKRFTAFITPKGSTTPTKVFEMFDYLDPAIFEYNTVVENPKFAPEAKTAGAVSGVLPIKDGDTLSWECHVINDSQTPLRYTNEVKTGEMCNLWGTSLGIEKFNCLKQ